MKLTHQIIQDEKSYTIQVQGQMDASNALKLDELIATVLTSNPTNLCMDFSELEYISSAGCGVILSHLKEMQDRRIKLCIYNMSDNIKSVFDLLGLDNFISIVDTKEEAANINSGAEN